MKVLETTYYTKNYKNFSCPEKKSYTKPQITVSCLETQVIASSGRGCSCGCYSRDYPQTNEGCWGCPNCKHGNSGNHACDDESEGFWSHEY